MALLTGCGHSSPEIIRIPIEKTVIEKVRVPEALLRDCGTPDLDSLYTTGDLEREFGKALVALETCNQDKERIRSWQQEE